MKRILVVDDEKELAEVISEQLSNMGYHTGVAYDGVEAVLSVIDQQWDVVLMDIRMPKLDGINALKIIHKLAPHISVITMTGQASQNDIIEATKQGAYHCLLKPVRLEEIFKAIMLTPGRDIS